jgi:hypothetical protein
MRGGEMANYRPLQLNMNCRAFLPFGLPMADALDMDMERQWHQTACGACGLTSPLSECVLCPNAWCDKHGDAKVTGQCMSCGQRGRKVFASFPAKPTARDHSDVLPTTGI